MDILDIYTKRIFQSLMDGEIAHARVLSSEMKQIVIQQEQEDKKN